jgi:hypothetical protein
MKYQDDFFENYINYYHKNNDWKKIFNSESSIFTVWHNFPNFESGVTILTKMVIEWKLVIKRAFADYYFCSYYKWFHLALLRNCLKEEFQGRLQGRLVLELKKNRIEIQKSLNNSANSELNTTFWKLIELMDHSLNELSNLANSIEKELEKIVFAKDKEYKLRIEIPIQKWDMVRDNNSMIAKGRIYVLSHEQMDDVYKIGFTTKTVEQRSKALSNEHNLSKNFNIEYDNEVYFPFLLEQRVLKRLSNKIEYGEFVAEELDKIKSIIGEEMKKLNEQLAG